MENKKKKRFYIRLVILTLLVVAIVFTIYSNLTKEKTAVLQVGTLHQILRLLT